MSKERILSVLHQLNSNYPDVTNLSSFPRSKLQTVVHFVSVGAAGSLVQDHRQTTRQSKDAEHRSLTVEVSTVFMFITLVQIL